MLELAREEVAARKTFWRRVAESADETCGSYPAELRKRIDAGLLDV